MEKVYKITLNLESDDSRYFYAKEKISLAIYELVTYEGDVRYRLTKAYMCFHLLRSNYFPDALRREWDDIYNSMTKKGPYRSQDGRILLDSCQNTMRAIRNSTASKLAARILELHYKLNCY